MSGGKKRSTDLELAFGFVVVLGAGVGLGHALWLRSIEAILPAFVTSLFILVTGVLHWLKPKSPIRRVLLVTALMLAIGPQYHASGVVIRFFHLPDIDAALRVVDHRLVGWLLPSWAEGQISIWLDRHPWIGPGTYFGKVIVEFLQIAYLSFFAWGFFFLWYLIYAYWRSEKLNRKAEECWLVLKVFACGWIGPYYLSFFSYMMFPAIGPRYANPEQYVHDINGFGLAGAIAKFIESQQVSPRDCFPSGHTGLTWIVALLALRIAPTYGRFMVPVAVLMTTATLVLRYHYIADVLAAGVMIAGSILWAGLYPRKRLGDISEVVPSLIDELKQPIRYFRSSM